MLDALACPLILQISEISFNLKTFKDEATKIKLLTLIKWISCFILVFFIIFHYWMKFCDVHTFTFIYHSINHAAIRLLLKFNLRMKCDFTKIHIFYGPSE